MLPFDPILLILSLDYLSLVSQIHTRPKQYLEKSPNLKTDAVMSGCPKSLLILNCNLHSSHTPTERNISCNRTFTNRKSIKGNVSMSYKEFTVGFAEFCNGKLFPANKKRKFVWKRETHSLYFVLSICLYTN